MSLKTFCWISVVDEEISCANLQLTKFVSSFKNMSGNLFSTFWHLVVMFGQNDWFEAFFQNSVLSFRWNKQIIILRFFKKKFIIFYICIINVITDQKTRNYDLFVSHKTKCQIFFYILQIKKKKMEMEMEMEIYTVFGPRNKNTSWKEISPQSGKLFHKSTYILS